MIHDLFHLRFREFRRERQGKDERGDEKLTAMLETVKIDFTSFFLSFTISEKVIIYLQGVMLLLLVILPGESKKRGDSTHHS